MKISKDLVIQEHIHMVTSDTCREEGCYFECEFTCQLEA